PTAPTRRYGEATRLLPCRAPGSRRSVHCSSALLCCARPALHAASRFRSALVLVRLPTPTVPSRIGAARLRPMLPVARLCAASAESRARLSVLPLLPAWYCGSPRPWLQRHELVARDQRMVGERPARRSRCDAGSF